MKKSIITLILLTLSVCSFAYYDYWNGQLYSGGPYVNDMMTSMPSVKGQYATLSKQYVTDGNLGITVTMQLGWYNFFRRLALSYYWADWNVQGFNYERRVYTSPEASNTYTEVQALRKTEQYLDVSAVSVRSTDKTGLSNYSSQYNEYLFCESMNLNTTTYTAGKGYKIKIEYTFTPVVFSEHDGYHYNPDETTRYIRSQGVQISQTSTGSQLVFKNSNTKVNSVINVNATYNPYYNTGSGDRYLVYGNPDAIISLFVDTINLPCTKSKVVGSTLNTTVGYGSFLASVGAASKPTYVDPLKAQGGCGIIYYGCSRECNSETSKSVEYLADNTLHQSFLKKKKYDTTSSCYLRYTNLLTRSLNSDLTLYDENSVEDFSQSCREDFRMSRIYHLRDISNVVVNTKESYGAGTILKFQHSAIYESKIDINKNSKIKSLFALGYTYYGPSYNLSLANGSGVVSNVIDIEVVSPVTIPRLSTGEKEARLTCVTDSLAREGDFIHLQGKKISCGVYSPSLYMPEYMWEVSFDGSKWETITSENFSNYIVDRYRLKYAIIMDNEKDLLIKSTILKNKEKALFRQKVVLKSFSSNEVSSLYSYEGGDGRYYISVSATDCYTYIPTPILDSDNFAFSPLSFPAEQRVCSGDEPTNKKISFRLRSSANVSTEQIDRMAGIAGYRIYELKNGIPSKLISNSATYTINWKGESVAYRCVISWCRDSIYKDIRIVANPVERMNTDMVSSTSILCPQGLTPTLTVSDTTGVYYEYLYRDTLWHNFSYKNTTELPATSPSAVSDIFYIKKRNMSTGCESDSLKITVTYFKGIENNLLAFAAAADASKSVVYVVKDSPSPAIKGFVISGGYGTPDTGNSYTYIYNYLYREPGGIWQPLSTGGISLDKDAFIVDRKTEICRVAISRNSNDVATQVSDTSNILTIDVIEPLLLKDVVVSGDGKCAGTKVSVGIPGYDPSEESKEWVRYVWSATDDSLTLVMSGDMDKYCDIYNTTQDFDLIVYREDSLLNVRTPELTIPIKVYSVKPAFSIVTNGDTEESILDYTDETFVFQTGTRFELKNKSEGADSYVWNLELQYYTGVEVEGLKSYLENPVCYLYNQGQNKIRLTAKNAMGCEGSVTAENLYIQTSSLRSAEAVSHFADPDKESSRMIAESAMFNLYPTVTDGEPLKLFYSDGAFRYTLFNSLGQVIEEAEAESYVEIPMKQCQAGLYQIAVTPVTEDVSKIELFKIIRK